MDPSTSTKTAKSSKTPAIRFDWASVECKLTQCPVVPTRKLPDDCRETNSLIIDRRDSPITDTQIFELFKDTCISVSFRPQRHFLQLMFPDTTTAERVLAKGPYQVKGTTLPLFPPKGKLAPQNILKLANVPIRLRTVVERTIRDALAPHMAVIEAVPYTIKNTHFMTSRWDVVIEPAHSNPMMTDVPVIFKILGETVVASWPGSPPSCLSCLAAHGTQDCLKKQPVIPPPDKSYAKVTAGTSSTADNKQIITPKPNKAPLPSASSSGTP